VRHGKNQRWRRLVSSLSLLAAVPLVAAVAQVWSPQLASGANVVNETFQFPLAIDLNTCTTPVDPVALSGTMHIVVTTTSDSSGGYHTTVSSNTQSVTGTGLLSGETYSSSSEYEDEYYDAGPFPQVNTATHEYELISRSGTANLIIKVTFHVTVNANGIPTAGVDNVSSGCQG
jgi:hypothetical protein